MFFYENGIALIAACSPSCLEMMRAVHMLARTGLHLTITPNGPICWTGNSRGAPCALPMHACRSTHATMHEWYGWHAEEV